MKIFVVVPAYNEAKRVGNVLHELKRMKQHIVVVDDGSKDKTSKVARRYTPLVFRHTVNLGKGAALKTGCEAAFSLGADAVILMDSDGQHSPLDLARFTKTLKSKKCDVVFGVRKPERIPLVRLLGNSVVTLMVKVLFGISSNDILCGYKALTRKAYKKINWESNGYSVETEIVAMTGKYKLKNCEVGIRTLYYDKFKGLTVEKGLGIVFDVVSWKLLR